jgi:hypothetical protein
MLLRGANAWATPTTTTTDPRLYRDRNPQRLDIFCSSTP